MEFVVIFTMIEQHRDIEEILDSLGVRRFENISPANIKYLPYKAFIIILIVNSFGFLFLYAAFLSKLMPETGIEILDFMKYDYYYCYLVPLSILPTFIVVYLNWLSINYFEHN